MQESLLEFPSPLLVVDGGLCVLGFSAKTFTVLGLRPSKDIDQACLALGREIQTHGDLADELALATARLVRAGEEDQWIWVRGKRTFEVKVSARPDDLFWVLFEDVTDYAISEEILLNARSYLERVISHIPLGVVVLTGQLRISSMNPHSRALIHRLGGDLNPVDAIGETLERVIPAPGGAHWHALCQSAQHSGLREELTRRAYDVSDDVPCVLSVLATPLVKERESAAGIVLIVEDVTEKVQLENQLVNAEKLATLGQLAVTVKHEINNPLSIISTNAQMLRMHGEYGDDRARVKLERIEEQVRRIADVTERLRTMEEVNTEEYVRGGIPMIDLWKSSSSAQEADDENV